MEFYSAEVPEYKPLDSEGSLGFSSSINRLAEQPLDLNSILVQNPNSTFYMRVKGESMLEYRIYDGDILIIDRSTIIKSGMVILGIFNGEYVIKQIVFDENIKPLRIRLLFSNNDLPEIQITEYDQFEIWGQIVYTIHKHV